MILYIDMDGVVADFQAAVDYYHPGLNIGDVVSEEIYAVRKMKVENVCLENNRIFRDLPIIPGGTQAIRELRRHFDIYFLSTPMWIVPHSFMDKRIWLEKHFGSWSHERLILTARKDLCIGEFLVDDRLRNGVDRFTGEHIHFATEKFPDWPSVTNYLLAKILV